jgi:hypothetical protein
MTWPLLSALSFALGLWVGWLCRHVETQAHESARDRVERLCQEDVREATETLRKAARALQMAELRLEPCAEGFEK